MLTNTHILGMGNWEFLVPFEFEVMTPLCIPPEGSQKSFRRRDSTGCKKLRVMFIELNRAQNVIHFAGLFSLCQKVQVCIDNVDCLVAVKFLATHCFRYSETAVLLC